MGFIFAAAGSRPETGAEVDLHCLLCNLARFAVRYSRQEDFSTPPRPPSRRLPGLGSAIPEKQGTREQGNRTQESGSRTRFFRRWSETPVPD
jgi:hypothetical protein